MAAFLTSVSSVVVIVLMMALGYILRKNGWFDDSFSSNISKLITQIALPASIFISVQDHLTRDGLGNLITISSFRSSNRLYYCLVNS